MHNIEDTVELTIVKHCQRQMSLTISCCNFLPLYFPLPQHSLPPPSPEQIIPLPIEVNRTSDEELLFHFLSFIPPLKWGSPQKGGGESMVLIQMLHLKILLCSIWLREIKSIYKYTPWECFIPTISLAEKKKKSFCINIPLLIQFYTEEFEYLSKTFILPNPTTA